jgi:hypothetical protein
MGLLLGVCDTVLLEHQKTPSQFKIQGKDLKKELEEYNHKLYDEKWRNMPTPIAGNIRSKPVPTPTVPFGHKIAWRDGRKIVLNEKGIPI